MTQEENQRRDAGVARLMDAIQSVPAVLVGPHLTDDQFAEYCTGVMDEEAIAAVDHHLLSCQACFAEMEQLMDEMQDYEGDTGIQRLAVFSARIMGQSLPLGEASPLADVMPPERVPLTVVQPSVATEPALPQQTQSQSPDLPHRPSIRMLAASWQSVSLSLAGAAALLLIWIGGIRPMQQKNAAYLADIRRKQELIAQQQRQLDVEGAKAKQARIDEQQLAEAQKQRDTLQRERDKLRLMLTGVQAGMTAAQHMNTTLLSDNMQLKRKLAEGLMPLNEDDAARIASASRDGSLPLKIELPTTHDIAVRGGEDQLVGPNGTVVLSDQPRLHWNAMPNAVEYQVTVTNHVNAIVANTGHTPTLKPEWRVKPPLQRGEVYQWQVQPLNARNRPIDTPPTSGAKFTFRVLSPEALNRYLDAEFKLAVLYANQGIYDRAESLLDDVAYADSTGRLHICRLAGKLLTNIRQQRAKAAK